MTEDEKYEIAILAADVRLKSDIVQAHAMMNTPTDPIEREKAFVEYQIAQTELLEASAILARAQARIASKP